MGWPGLLLLCPMNEELGAGELQGPLQSRDDWLPLPSVMLQGFLGLRGAVAMETGASGSSDL